MKKDGPVKLWRLPAALALALAAAPCPFAAAAGYGDSEALYAAGRYREALPGFIDAVVADPGDERARERVRLCGTLALLTEEVSVSTEREELLREAESAKAALDRLQKAKAARLAAWELKAAAARKTAAGPDSLRDAIRSYSALLEDAPVYSDSLEKFREVTGSVKSALHAAIRSEYPDLAGEDASVDAKDLAAAAFASEFSDRARKSSDSPVTSRQILAEAARIRQLESSLEGLFSSAREAFRHQRAGAAEKAGPLWKELLRFDEANEEALLYLELSAARARAPRPPDDSAEARLAGEYYRNGLRDFAAGDAAKALTWWERSLKLDPGHPGARRAVAYAKKQ